MNIHKAPVQAETCTGALSLKRVAGIVREENPIGSPADILQIPWEWNTTGKSRQSSL
jgi:hypothetical protein